VLIVERNVKFPSSLTRVGLCTAENVGQKEEVKEEDIKLSQQLQFRNLFSHVFHTLV
jgi:hypothetical protein